MECWKYKVSNLRPFVVYMIDGKEMRRHEAVNYLMENRSYSQKESYDYLDFLPHI